ncbi:hypothetical protein [Aureibaculum marinum]|nr:hypothetical protein [Aureibaculum marinum]
MKKIFLVCFLLTSSFLLSQTTDKPQFWDKVQFGGGLGLSFSNNYTTISIAPSAIYNFNQYIAAGPGLSYLYAKNGSLKSNVFGVGLITLFNPTQNLQLSGEFEHLFITQKLGVDKSHFDYPSLYLGAAYRIGNFSAGLRYDVLYDSDKTIYASAFSPIIRFYF